MNRLNQTLKRSWITFAIVVVTLSIATFIIPGTVSEYVNTNGSVPDIPVLETCLLFVHWLQDNIIIAFIFQIILTLNICICDKIKSSKTYAGYSFLLYSLQLPFY